jgi:hypothetical protein
MTRGGTWLVWPMRTSAPQVAPDKLGRELAKTMKGVVKQDKNY